MGWFSAKADPDSSPSAPLLPQAEESQAERPQLGQAAADQGLKPFRQQLQDTAVPVRPCSFSKLPIYDF